MEEKELFTINDAAEYIGVTRVKISELVSKGELKTVRNPLDGRQKLITREQLDKLKQFQPAAKLNKDSSQE